MSGQIEGATGRAGMCLYLIAEKLKNFYLELQQARLAVSSKIALKLRPLDWLL